MEVFIDRRVRVIIALEEEEVKWLKEFIQIPHGNPQEEPAKDCDLRYSLWAALGEALE